MILPIFEVGKLNKTNITFVNPLYCSQWGQVQLLFSGYLTHELLLQNQQLTRQGSIDLKIIQTFTAIYKFEM